MISATRGVVGGLDRTPARRRRPTLRRSSGPAAASRRRNRGSTRGVRCVCADEPRARHRGSVRPPRSPVQPRSSDRRRAAEPSASSRDCVHPSAVRTSPATSGGRSSRRSAAQSSRCSLPEQVDRARYPIPDPTPSSSECGGRTTRGRKPVRRRDAPRRVPSRPAGSLCAAASPRRTRSSSQTRQHGHAVAHARVALRRAPGLRLEVDGLVGLVG